MTSHYRNTIFAVYLLFCLLATSWSAPSFIRQSTDDFVQQNYQEISSQDSNISASKGVTGLRNHSPASYVLKLESFTFLQSTIEIYKSRPFSVGGYDWTLVVYPKGNTKDGGSGYLSLYLAIENPNSAGETQVDVILYIFNNKERKYFTIQDTDIWRFSDIKRTLGFSQVLPLDDTFKNEYLSDDICEFGVDVTFSPSNRRREILHVTANGRNPLYTWNIARFSTLSGLSYESPREFGPNPRSWKIVMYPNGVGEGAGKYLSLSLRMVRNSSPSQKQVYVLGKFRVINQRNFSNYERPIHHRYDTSATFTDVEFMPLSDLNDPSKGFIVNDTLMLEVDFDASSLSISNYE